MITFNEMGLSAELLRGISDLGFTTPTPIQEQVIPVLMNEMRDVLGLAQTGTGKTAAFGIPSLEQIDMDHNKPQLLILSPTRELCLQITRDLETYGKYVQGLKIVSVYGGASMDTQIRALRSGAQVVVGTPGRMCDLIRRNKIDLSSVEILVLDEADEMLKMGFREDLDFILAQTPEDKNTLLFSATMASEIVRIAQKYMTSPLEISVGAKNTATASVSHKYMMVHAKDRYLALKRIVDFHPEIYGIVFCRTRSETRDVAAKLMRDGYMAEALHGDMSQVQRDEVMAKFRDKTIRVLVATDVAARGLDVDKLTHVIHFNLPDDVEVYNHRSGRTGRAGELGISISIIHTRERGRIAQIERIIKRKIEAAPVPGGREICERQLFALLERMKNTPVDEETIAPFMAKAEELVSDLSREELIKRFVSMEFSRFLAYYKGASDINAQEGSGRSSNRERYDERESAPSFDRGEKRNRGRKKVGDMAEVVLQIPAKIDMSKRDIIQMLVKASGARDIEIGNINLSKGKIVAEVEGQYMNRVIRFLNERPFRGMEVSAQANFEGLMGSRDQGFKGKRKRTKAAY
jgi:ATP-dependent RNA helicase DeaD